MEIWASITQWRPATRHRYLSTATQSPTIATDWTRSSRLCATWRCGVPQRPFASCVQRTARTNNSPSCYYTKKYICFFKAYSFWIIYYIPHSSMKNCAGFDFQLIFMLTLHILSFNREMLVLFCHFLNISSLFWTWYYKNVYICRVGNIVKFKQLAIHIQNIKQLKIQWTNFSNLAQCWR